MQSMEMGGKDGATGLVWNEMIAGGGEDGDEPLQASGGSKALHGSLPPAQSVVESHVHRTSGLSA